MQFENTKVYNVRAVYSARNPMFQTVKAVASKWIFISFNYNYEL